MASQRFTKDSTATLMLPQVSKRGPTTRSKNSSISKDEQNMGISLPRSKRKADHSPLKNERVKRSALGNLTNAVFENDENSKAKGANVTKKTVLKKIAAGVTKIQPFKDTFSKPTASIVPRMTKIPTRASTRSNNLAKTSTTNSTGQVDSLHNILQQQRDESQIQPVQSINKTVLKKEVVQKDELKVVANRTATRRISNEFEKTEESLYVSALEDISPADTTTSTRTRSSIGEVKKYPSIDEEVDDINSKAHNSSIQSSGPVPEGVHDFDQENCDDMYNVSEYAMDIFNYLRERERVYHVTDYMSTQSNISRWMRSLLIDWMVEVQESFGLNHETLYLAIKLIDRYLAKESIQKELLQLLGAAALFISAKFDERTPPLIEDFLYICDGAYDQSQLIKMEIQVFKSVNYDLGIPISYRFLRRYARCAKLSMIILTLARYVLEYSLMDYDTIFESDSKLAAAALFIALKMSNLPGWNKTLEYYSGYKFAEFAHLVVMLNSGLLKRPKDTLNTIRNKYSHTVFHCVAKKTVLETAKLLENDQDYI